MSRQRSSDSIRPATDTGRYKSSDTYRRSTRPTRRKHVFKGTPVVPGIAMGRVRLKFRQTQVLSDLTITEAQVPREIEVLKEAVRQAKEQLMLARSKVAQEIGELEATIFDTHIALLEDRSFLGKVEEQVRSELKPAEVVVSVIVEGYFQTLSMVEDENLRERAADIRDVGLRLLDNLHNVKHDAAVVDKAIERHVGEGDIVFARELLPSDIATFEHRHVAGVFAEAGSARGHCAIMLRALGTPTVMGVEGVYTILRDGDFVIVDGSSGTVFVNPRKDIVDSYKRTQHDFHNYQNLLNEEVELPAVTTDGVQVSLLANVSKQSEVALGHMYRMDGVGLYRTEFGLMVRNSFPDEDELYQIYRNIVKAMDGKPVTIRTMDIGTDKILPYIKMPHENNPALGRRSFRLAMELDEFQSCQLRAILRAAHYGDVRVMFPLITALDDIRMARRMIRLACRQLEERKRRYNPDIQVGMMVEVPAAAMSLGKYVREVQFFSVGTNDLIQYTCAADRDQIEAAHWYRGTNPGFLALLRHIVQEAEAYNRPVSICGEMAGDPFYTMFLIGLGVRHLSMAPPQIPLVKKIIRSINLPGAQRLAERALQLGSTAQIGELFQTTVERILGRDITVWTRSQSE